TETALSAPKYSRTKVQSQRLPASRPHLTVYLDDCVCKRRKLSTKNECTPAYTKQVALKPDCTVGVRKKPGTCRGLFMTVTELRTTYRNCRCRTTRKRVRVRCACPKTKVRTRCDGNVKMRISTVYRLKRNSCKVETKVKRIPISCPKNRVKSRSSCRADCSQTVTETWAEVRNCRCVRPVKKRTVSAVSTSSGRCKEKVKVTKKPIVCNKKYRPVKSSCAFNGYRRVILYNQERRGCECVKRRRITYEKCGCGKDYTTEKCDDNVWIVKAVTHKMDGAKSACKRSVAVRKKPIKCRGKLHRRVSRCQSDGYRVVRQLVEESSRLRLRYQGDFASGAVPAQLASANRWSNGPKRSAAVQGPVHRRVCSADQVETIYSTKYKLVDGLCLAEEDEKVIPNKCPSKPLYRRGRCGSDGERVDTWVHHSLRKCVCHQRVKRLRLRCHCLEEETPIYGRCRGARKGRSAGQRLIRGAFVKPPDPELQMRQTNSKCDENRSEHKSACGKRGYQTVTLTYHKLVSCACVKKHKKRRKKMCRPVMAPLKAGPCNKETGFQTTELTFGRVVLLPPPQNRYACLVKKVKMKRRCACPKPARTVKCRRNVLITVTVTQKLKGQKCIKAKKVDKKATSCPDPIISTRCVRHTIKERSTVSYQLKSERCRRKKQVSKKKIKCKGGTKVTRTKCDKRCNQKVTKVTRYIRNCECRKKTDISSVKCCCPKSVTRVACIDDSRRVVTTTSWRLVRGACQRKARKREKKIE
uniref:VWFA domain-containing protein n=1 Tax=Macrostomum lignano TaxID=282301 RepID=A0A1I8HBH7_9PLAT